MQHSYESLMYFIKEPTIVYLWDDLDVTTATCQDNVSRISDCEDLENEKF